MQEEKRPLNDWLPVTKKELKHHGWDELDVILVSGDAYVDHPAFGTAVIGRIIEDEGFSVAIIAQPNWQDDLRDFKKFNEIYATYFKENQPCRTTVAIDSLPTPIAIELKCIATI